MIAASTAINLLQFAHAAFGKEAYNIQGKNLIGHEACIMSSGYDDVDVDICCEVVGYSSQVHCTIMHEEVHGFVQIWYIGEVGREYHT